MNWEDILNLPSATLAHDRTIPKTQVVLQGNLSKTEEKRLNAVAKLTHYASLIKGNTYMMSVRNEDYDIESIIVLRCAMKTTVGASDVAALLHKVFPNPTILLFEFPDNAIGLSAAIKRKSKAEHGAVVVEQQQNTRRFSASSAEYQGFLQQITYNALPQTDLLQFMSALADRIMLSRTIDTLGFYPKCQLSAVETFMGHVKQFETLQSSINALQEQRKDKETTLSASTKIRIELKGIKQQQDAIIQEIRNLCHE